jgi:hypothetical protein
VFDCPSGLPIIWVSFFGGDSPVKLRDVCYTLHGRSGSRDLEDG